MTKQIKKLSCEECGSNDLEFKIFVDEFGEPTSDIQEQIRTGNMDLVEKAREIGSEIDANEKPWSDIEPTQEAWCNTCEMWQGVKE